jgi:hypothetical protein
MTQDRDERVDDGAPSGTADGDVANGTVDGEVPGGASDGDAPSGAIDGDAPSGEIDGDAHSGSGDRPAVVERDVVENAFADAAPRTLAEVVDATGLERDAAERVLATLVDAGELATKTLPTPSPASTARDGDDAATQDGIGGEDADGLRVWYRPARRHVERFASDADVPAADALDDAIAALDVPGVSEMMQDWRRDAIRGAWEYVADAGAATDDAIVDAVYPAHGAGYEDREAWWACVRPRLAELPGIVPPDEGDTDVWTYAPN